MSRRVRLSPGEIPHTTPAYSAHTLALLVKASSVHAPSGIIPDQERQGNILSGVRFGAQRNAIN
jgi:hypothetical protein